MFLMVEKGIRGVVRHTIYRYAKANNKYRKDYYKNKEPLLLGCKKNLYGWTMSRKLPVNNPEWIKYTFQFNEDFIKNYAEENDEGYFLEVDVQYPENVMDIRNLKQALNHGLVLKKVHKVIKFN